MNKNPNVTLIGCGNMGQALLSGWLARGDRSLRYHVIDPNPLPASLAKHKRVTCAQNMDARIEKTSVVVLAVKPQAMDEACLQLRPFLSPRALVVSIAAGRSLKSFERLLGARQPIIRTMPNLPAAVGYGMTVGVAGKTVKPAHKRAAQSLFECVGQYEWLAREKDIDAATALMGNGPAYVFYLAELLGRAGKANGLNAKQAERMARQTLIGAARLLEHRADTNPSQLRTNVTSPGGTTEAAMKILLASDIQKIFNTALKAGKERSAALSR